MIAEKRKLFFSFLFFHTAQYYKSLATAAAWLQRLHLWLCHMLRSVLFAQQCDSNHGSIQGALDTTMS